MNNCVYILLCKNNRYYIGSAADLITRLRQHILGYVKTTKNIRPLVLVFFQGFATVRKARQIEYWLKKLKNKKIIDQIIRTGHINKKFKG